MSRIIAVSNQKGGVGKTTTAGALTAAFTKKGQRVLAVDMDPQGNLSFSLGVDNEEVPTSYEVMRGEVTAREAIRSSPIADIIPANILLSGADLEFSGKGREFLLAHALRPLQGEYDYIFIDTPPALSVLTVNAFTAADGVIIPMLGDIFSLQGITQLYDTIVHVQQFLNPGLHFEGILLTRYEPRTKLAAEVKGTAEMVSAELDIPLFHTVIRNSVQVSEAQALQRSLLDYAPRNIAAKDYLALAEEILYRHAQSPRKDEEDDDGQA